MVKKLPQRMFGNSLVTNCLCIGAAGLCHGSVPSLAPI